MGFFITNSACYENSKAYKKRTVTLISNKYFQIYKFYGMWHLDIVTYLISK